MKKSSFIAKEKWVAVTSVALFEIIHVMSCVPFRNIISPAFYIILAVVMFKTKRVGRVLFNVFTCSLLVPDALDVIIEAMTGKPFNSIYSDIITHISSVLIVWNLVLLNIILPKQMRKRSSAK